MKPNSIRFFRKKAELSQSKLAAALKTTQATIARWEKGLVEVPSTKLRDLAAIFGTSVDKILRQNISDIQVDSVEEKWKDYLDDTYKTRRYWGDLTFKLKNIDKYFSFPISRKEFGLITPVIYSSVNDQFMEVNTLNFRKLLINPRNIEVLIFRDDDGDPPDEFNYDQDNNLYPEEVYINVDRFFNNNESYLEGTSETLKSICQDFIKRGNYNAENWDNYFYYISIFFSDGKHQNHFKDEESILELLERSKDEAMFNESGKFLWLNYEGDPIFYNKEVISMLNYSTVQKNVDDLKILKEKVKEGKM